MTVYKVTWEEEVEGNRDIRREREKGRGDREGIIRPTLKRFMKWC